MPIENPAFISQGPFSRMRELVSTLKSEGIGAEIVVPPGADTNA